MGQEKKENTVIVLGGKTGLLGQALVRALTRKGRLVFAPGRNELDIGDEKALSDYLAEVNPGYVFNAIGYTRVDAAEDEPGEAFALNRDLPDVLGRLTAENDMGLIHYSTDYVFDGKKGDPYEPEDEPRPLSVYGAGKLAGEQAAVGANPDRAWVIRSAWLFGPGRTNFVKKIIDAAREKGEVRVVSDQIGSPTYTLDLAQWSLALVAKGKPGIYHAVNSGRASWFDLARAAVSLAGLTAEVIPITTDQFPVKAARPAFSVLSVEKMSGITGLRPRSWKQALTEYVPMLMD